MNTKPVIYRPLYKNGFLEEADFCSRPIEMWSETVTKDGKTLPRFQKIIDPATIAELERIKAEIDFK